MRASVTGLFSLLFFITDAVAQRECLSVAYNQLEARNNPSLLASHAKIESFIQSRLSSNEPRMSPSGTTGTGLNVIKIPVVVHVLYNTDEQKISHEQVSSQIQEMNKGFRKLNRHISNLPDPFKAHAADCFIEFQLASTDPYGNATSGITWKRTNNNFFGADDGIKFSNRGGDDAWNADKYLNIWVGKLSPGNIGYSSLPGAPKAKDGIVISYTAFGTTETAKAPYHLGATAIHEAGHWLGLQHIWGDRFCGDDGIDDTPPQRGPTAGCPTGSVTACNSSAAGAMYMNFMDLTHDPCTNMFTNNQRDRMRAMFADGGPRHALLTGSAAAVPALPVEAVIDSIATLAASIYPNPAAHSITVDTRSGVGDVLVVMDRIGKVVLRQRILAPRMTIPVSALQAGMYFVKIGKQGSIYKFVKAG